MRIHGLNHVMLNLILYLKSIALLFPHSLMISRAERSDLQLSVMEDSTWGGI